MTDHKPLPVAGYKSQSQDDVDLANELKYAEERYLRLLDKLSAMKKPVGIEHPDYGKPRFDGRFLALARTAMQEANMWAVRSIFNPSRISLPEDTQ